MLFSIFAGHSMSLWILILSQTWAGAAIRMWSGRLRETKVTKLWPSILAKLIWLHGNHKAKAEAELIASVCGQLNDIILPRPDDITCWDNAVVQQFSQQLAASNTKTRCLWCVHLVRSENVAMSVVHKNDQRVDILTKGLQELSPIAKNMVHIMAHPSNIIYNGWGRGSPASMSWPAMDYMRIMQWAEKSFPQNFLCGSWGQHHMWGHSRLYILHRRSVPLSLQCVSWICGRTRAPPQYVNM